MNRTKCFKYIRDFQSREESESWCKGHGGHLAALASNQDLDFALRLCGQSTDGCWVGGRGTNSSVGFTWKWSDNTTHWSQSLFGAVVFPSNCGNTSCHNNTAVDLCTLLTNGSTIVMGERCNASHASICMVDSGLHSKRQMSKKSRKSRKVSNPAASALVPPSWKVFTKEELHSLTKNFSEGNRLHGDAKTGGTYSGLLPDGSRLAVKRLKRSSFQRKKEFYSEVGKAARLHHPNLVSIKGCCYDHGDRYIVYEFIVNGPLDRWLHHMPRGGRCSDWNMRMKIATTLAQGIA
ncbi:unnamed protein product [Linum tenue]|uniref:Protein kinase domain-containing protein n=1 Tax=Linum tenue TaxID=586396 RepID=A0AAV0IVP4_9ROSI|nr:unnamed protein product [Linum tenue]